MFLPSRLHAAPWLTRCMGTAPLTRALPLLLVALVGAALWAVHASAPSGEPRQWGALFSSVAGVAAGCAALAWVRPQRVGLSPPHVMLSLGFGGMLLGLTVDVAQTGPARLAALCSQSSALDLLQSLALHLQFLPWMHFGMAVGGLLAIPSLRILRRHCGQYLCSLFLQNLLCSSWMLLGMTAGAVWFGRWPWLGGTSTLTGMLGGMFVGMTWGMVISVALYRGFFKWRNRCQALGLPGLER
jgi:hypothetical protein